uniref:Uncharacterized protein n=1 Tax=Nelumbo nucifera TaxID=4432 RepID=A0A822Y0F9_NELNU|nr:TPA_asm: hypothetical protein HUJ06_024591 [Nelumbo nucifera]
MFICFLFLFFLSCKSWCSLSTCLLLSTNICVFVTTWLALGFPNSFSLLNKVSQLHLAPFASAFCSFLQFLLILKLYMFGKHF